MILFDGSKPNVEYFLFLDKNELNTESTEKSDFHCYQCFIDLLNKAAYNLISEVPAFIFVPMIELPNY